MKEGEKLVIREVGSAIPNVTGSDWRPTDADRARWIEEYGGYMELDVEGRVCYIRQISVGIMQYAMTCLQQSEQAYSEALEKNLWLSGDPAIHEDPEMLRSLHDQLGVVVEPVDVVYTREGNVYDVQVGEYRCKLRPVTPAFLDAAQRNNRKQKPLQTEISLVKLMWLEGDQQILNDPHNYIGLLVEVTSLRQKYLVTVKKFYGPPK